MLPIPLERRRVPVLRAPHGSAAGGFASIRSNYENVSNYDDVRGHSGAANGKATLNVVSGIPAPKPPPGPSSSSDCRDPRPPHDRLRASVSVAGLIIYRDRHRN